MARIRYSQKTSAKHTRAEKEALTREAWRIINELRQYENKLKEAMSKMDEMALDEVRILAKSGITSAEHIAAKLSKQFKVKISSKTTTRVKFGVPSQFFVKPSSALAAFFPAQHKGLFNSIYNVISQAPEGASYWVGVIMDYIRRFGVDSLGWLWTYEYFDNAHGYEYSRNSDVMVWNFDTDYVTGIPVLDTIKKEAYDEDAKPREEILSD